MDISFLAKNKIGATVGAAASRFLPEPASRGVGMFRDAMKAVGKAATDVASGASSEYDLGEFQGLFEMQLAAQREMQMTTMASNVERSKHESKMSILRNIRIS